MKQMDKEQLGCLINEITVKVLTNNKDSIEEHISDSVQGKQGCNAIFTNAMISYGVELIKQFEQVLMETLYSILYND